MSDLAAIRAETLEASQRHNRCVVARWLDSLDEEGRAIADELLADKDLGHLDLWLRLRRSVKFSEKSLRFHRKGHCPCQ